MPSFMLPSQKRRERSKIDYASLLLEDEAARIRIRVQELRHRSPTPPDATYDSATRIEIRRAPEQTLVLKLLAIKQHSNIATGVYHLGASTIRSMTIEVEVPLGTLYSLFDCKTISSSVFQIMGDFR